jgi:hypothetical protein
MGAIDVGLPAIPDFEFAAFDIMLVSTRVSKPGMLPRIAM